MYDNIPILFHVIILLALIATGGGLWIGLTSRRNVDSEVIGCLSWGGTLCFFLCTLALLGLSSADPSKLSSMVSEVLGLALCLCLLFGSLGIGLAIGPERRQ